MKKLLKLDSLVKESSDLTEEEETFVQEKLAEGQLIAKGFMYELEKEGFSPKAVARKAIAGGGKLVSKAKSGTSKSWNKLVNAMGGTKTVVLPGGETQKFYRIGSRGRKILAGGTIAAGTAGVAGAGVGTAKLLKKKDKTASEPFKLTTKTAEYYQIGINLAMDALEKQAVDKESGITVEMVEKVAEMRAERVLAAERIKTATEVWNDLIAKYAEAGNEEISEDILKYAENELAAVEEKAPLVNIEVVEDSKEEPTEEEAAQAAIQGAAEVLADLTGKAPDDPEVQEAAVEVVQDAVESMNIDEGEAATEEE